MSFTSHFKYDKLRIVESIKKLFSQISRRYRRAKIEKYCGRESLQTTFCNRFLGCDLNNFKGKGRLVAKWTSEGSRNVHNPLAERKHFFNIRFCERYYHLLFMPKPQKMEEHLLSLRQLFRVSALYRFIYHSPRKNLRETSIYIILILRRKSEWFTSGNRLWHNVNMGQGCRLA